MTALAQQPAQELEQLLSRIRVSSQVVPIGGDVFVPIVLPGGVDSIDAELLDEALAERHTVLREVGEHGDVNRVLVSHYGERLLLLVDGEQLIGAKQNRVFNASFLVAPGAHEVAVAVSCVERGRWAYRDRRFTASDTTLTGMARSRKLSRVTKSVITGGDYDAQQRAVWDDVDDYLDRSRVISRTAAFDDAVQSRRDITLTGIQALTPLTDQVGVGLVRAGKLVLMDVFGSASLYARCYRKITAGMLSDPTDGTAKTDEAAGVVADAVRRLRHATPMRRPAPSCGETLHGEVGRLSVGAIVYGGHAYHLVAGVA
jgi:hypothetical protein